MRPERATKVFVSQCERTGQCPKDREKPLKNLRKGSERSGWISGHSNHTAEGGGREKEEQMQEEKSGS